MCGERHSNRKDLHVKVRPADLDAPTLVDRISAELLDHLIVCRTCSVIFAAQQHSLGEVGCVEGALALKLNSDGRKEDRFLPFGT
jgi:hypothetical protein